MLRTRKGFSHLKFFNSLLVIVIFCTLAVTGCKDTPTSVGYGLLGPGNIPNLAIDTALASSYATIPQTTSTFSSDKILVGKYPGYTSFALLRFTELPVGLFDTVNVTDVQLQLSTVYNFGNSSAPLAFLGYQLIAHADSATYDSLTTGAAMYYGSNPMLSFAPTTLSDTAIVQCALDTSVVRSWFTTAGSANNFGIILVPTNVNTVKGFGSFLNSASSNRPQLIIHYTSQGNSDTVVYNSGVARFLANVDKTWLTSLDPQCMFVQSGVAYRGQLYFNLRTLPKAGLILKAELEVTYDPLVQPTLNTFAEDSLFAFYVANDSAVVDLTLGSTITSGSAKIYRFDVANFMRAWANGDTLQRIQLAGTRENSSLDLFPLYGTFSSSGLRPRLIYTHVTQ